MATLPSAHPVGAPPAVLRRREGGLSIFSDPPAGEFWSAAATVAAVTQPVSLRQRRPADGAPTVEVDGGSRAGEDSDVPIDRGGDGRIGHGHRSGAPGPD